MNKHEWNLHAHEFEDAICDVTADETNNQLARFVRAARLPSHPLLVDLGCGVGSFVQKFGDRFSEVIAVDFAARIIARAKDRCTDRSGVTWMVADIASAFKIIGTRADLTVCMNVITSPSPAKRKALWTCLAKVTKRRGYALIVVSSLESNRMVEQRYLRQNRRLASKSNGLVRREDSWQKHFERTELVTTLAHHGFTVSRLGRVAYSWAHEGLRNSRGAKTQPWDWICLAQRV